MQVLILPFVINSKDLFHFISNVYDGYKEINVSRTANVIAKHDMSQKKIVQNAVSHL